MKHFNMFGIKGEWKNPTGVKAKLAENTDGFFFFFNAESSAEPNVLDNPIHFVYQDSIEFAVKRFSNTHKLMSSGKP